MIVICITYRAIVNCSCSSSKVIKECHFYITDDIELDTLFVQHYLFQHWNWLDENGVNLEEHMVFSDGPSSQFKTAERYTLLVNILV